MPLFQTYPLKTSYSGNDILVITDTDIDPNTSKPIDETKSLRLSTLVNAASGGLTLTTTGTSGAATFDTNTKVLNIPIYSNSPDNNTTYDLNVPSTGILRLTGSDGTTDNVSFSGIGGITITSLASNNIAIDGSGISGGVSQVTAATPAASTGTPLVITPTTGNVTAQSRAYAGGSNVGHVPSGGTSTTFLRGDGNFSTVVTATPAFAPLPHMMATTSIAIGSATCYQIKAISTVKMSPTKIRLFFPTAAGENISIAIYTATTSSTVMSNATLYASIVNQDIGSDAGEQGFTLTQETGVGDIAVGDGIVLVLSIKGGGGGDTMLVGSGVSDAGLAVISQTQPFIESGFPDLLSNIATGFSATSRRIAYFLY
jgi:hypothetical protein